MIQLVDESKQNKRMIDRAQRKIARERTKLGTNEKKYLNEIKTLAKQNKHVHLYGQQLKS